jgi:hypothetical protein
LVRAGLITQEQLHAAHDARQKSGGTLAEVLIGGGVLSEDALVGFYRQRLLVPRVAWAELGKVPARVITKLPKEIAGEFRVVPLELDREGNLTVAMADPSDTHAVDEIGFFTGAFVMRAVAAPSVIAWALYHYYQITTPLLPRLMAKFPGAPPQALARDARTLVGDQAPANRPPEAAPAVAPPPVAVAVAAPPAPGSPPAPVPAPPVLLPTPPVLAPAPISRAAATATTLVPPLDPTAAPAPAPTPPLAPAPAEPLAALSGEIPARPSRRQAVIVDEPTTSADAETAIVLDRPRRSDGGDEPKVIIAAELTPPRVALPPPPRLSKPQAVIVADNFGEDTPIPAPVPLDITGQQFLLGPELVSPPTAPPSVSAQAALTGALEVLRFAQDRDAITMALVTYMGRLCRRAAFFAMKKGELLGWQGTGPGVTTDELRHTILKLDRPGTLREIVQARLPYRGPVADTVTRDFLIDALGGWAPAEQALFMPLCLRDRVVGVLYGDDELEPVPDAHVQKLMAAAAAALETVLVARKSQ